MMYDDDDDDDDDDNTKTYQCCGVCLGPHLTVAQRSV